MIESCFILFCSTCPPTGACKSCGFWQFYAVLCRFMQFYSAFFLQHYKKSSEIDYDFSGLSMLKAQSAEHRAKGKGQESLSPEH